MPTKHSGFLALDNVTPNANATTMLGNASLAWHTTFTQRAVASGATGIVSTVFYTKPGGATGVLQFMSGILWSSS